MDNRLAVDEGDAHAVIEFDLDDGVDAIVMGIIDGLSAVSGTDPLDMEPLQSYVDTDALAAMIASHTARTTTEGDLTVHLDVDDYEVRIESYGRIHVTERDADARTPRASS